MTEDQVESLFKMLDLSIQVPEAVWSDSPFELCWDDPDGRRFKFRLDEDETFSVIWWHPELDEDSHLVMEYKLTKVGAK